MKLTKFRLALLLAFAATLLVTGLVARKVIKRMRSTPSAALVAPLAQGPRVRTPLEAAEVIYDAKLARDWDDWGWGPHELGNGPAKVVFAGFGGILFHHAELRQYYGGLAFRFKAPAEWGDFIQVSLRQRGKPDDAFPLVLVTERHVAELGDGWREVLVDWQELNPQAQPFDRVMIGSHEQVGTDWVLLDQVMLTKAAVGATRPQDGKLVVVCDASSQPISELIYGTAGDDWESGQSAQRIGGNPLSRTNWELGAWNVGSDWFFENQGQKSNMFEVLAQTAKERRKLAVVVPMLGWVAKDTTSVGFPRAKFGAQRKHDPYRPEAGDGHKPDGTPIPPGDPTQTSVAAPPELIQAWVSKLVQDVGKASARRVHMYILDNEPSLWNTTHRDVHPEPVSYDELLDRTIKYATAIRNADPEAVIAGPAEWGWTGYEFSAVDREAGLQRRPDRNAHGGTPLVAWYLKKLAEHERATGKRLLDVFDLHFYPAAEGVWGANGGTDVATSELRLRSTRALWDSSYEDESWIKESVRLIPRMKDWVRDNYPGRKLSIGEWSFGAEDHISGGLATAEALGRFGQQGLDAAFYWGGMKKTSPTYWAFRAFRNFDERGGRFLDFSLPAQETDGVSLFASRDASATRLVLVLVNRKPSNKQSAVITLQGCGSVASSRLFSFAEGSKAFAPGASTITETGISAQLEPFSITVLDLRVKRAP